MRLIRPLIIIACIAVLAVPALARGRKSASTEPGSYKSWGPDIDQIEIVQTFDFADYSRIVVEPLDTSKTPLPDEDDNAHQPVTKVLASATEGYIQGLRGEVDAEVTTTASAGAAPGALIIRGRVLEMDPGSKAARFWAGFGAGAARAKVEAEIVDAASGAVLVRFTQERRSGVGVMGGDYQELMQRNLNAIGKDTANLLASFR